VKQFITNHQADVMGVLNGFDRIRFRGTQRWLATVGGMMSFLWKVQVKLKEFKDYALDRTARLKQHVEALAEESGRPSAYLFSSQETKEDFETATFPRCFTAKQRTRPCAAANRRRSPGDCGCFGRTA
jgi:hypothetical protein